MVSLLTPSIITREAMRVIGQSSAWLEHIDAERAWKALQRKWDKAWMVRAPECLLRHPQSLRINVSTRYPQRSYGPALNG